MLNVDDYLAKLDPANREALERIRQIVRHATPGANEQMSYGIPGFKYQGKYLCGYAAFKDHLSFFPASNAIAELHDELAGFKLSTGTIQFTLDNQIPEALLIKLLAVRRSEIESK